MSTWNPWHGCTKISPGCLNCYVYRNDVKYGKDPSAVGKNSCFSAPIAKNRNGEYKLKPDGDYVYTCFTSDFFHPAADAWRAEAWSYMRIRSDLRFFFITKRIDRFYEVLPADWDDGYANVTICCTCENQEMADYRLPIFLSLPIREKLIIHEPLLGPVNIVPYLAVMGHDGLPMIRKVLCGGESGSTARICDYQWVLSLRQQCADAGVSFTFRQTGALLRKDGRLYRIPRKLQFSQARKAGINLD